MEVVQDAANVLAFRTSQAGAAPAVIEGEEAFLLAFSRLLLLCDQSVDLKGSVVPGSPATDGSLAAAARGLGHLVSRLSLREPELATAKDRSSGTLPSRTTPAHASLSLTPSATLRTAVATANASSTLKMHFSGGSENAEGSPLQRLLACGYSCGDAERALRNNSGRFSEALGELLQTSSLEGRSNGPVLSPGIVRRVHANLRRSRADLIPPVTPATTADSGSSAHHSGGPAAQASASRKSSADSTAASKADDSHSSHSGSGSGARRASNEGLDEGFALHSVAEHEEVRSSSASTVGAQDPDNHTHDSAETSSVSNPRSRENSDTMARPTAISQSRSDPTLLDKAHLSHDDRAASTSALDTPAQQAWTDAQDEEALSRATNFYYDPAPCGSPDHAAYTALWRHTAGDVTARGSISVASQDDDDGPVGGITFTALSLSSETDGPNAIVSPTPRLSLTTPSAGANTTTPVPNTLLAASLPVHDEQQMPGEGPVQPVNTWAGRPTSGSVTSVVSGDAQPATPAAPSTPLSSANTTANTPSPKPAHDSQPATAASPDGPSDSSAVQLRRDQSGGEVEPRPRGSQISGGRKESISFLLNRGFNRIQASIAMIQSDGDVHRALERLGTTSASSGSLPTTGHTPAPITPPKQADSSIAPLRTTSTSSSKGLSPSSGSHTPMQPPGRPLGMIFEQPPVFPPADSHSGMSSNTGATRQRSKSLPDSASQPSSASAASTVEGSEGHEAARDVHIAMDWKREAVDGQDVVRVKSGTLPALLNHLLAPLNDDPDYVRTFAVCAHLFTTVETVLAHLWQAHTRVVSSLDARSASVRVLRLVKALTVCLPYYWRAFDDAALQHLYAVLATAVTMGHCTAVTELRARLLAARCPSLPRAPTASLHVSTSRTLLDLNVVDLAQQMTMLQHQCLRDVRISEMLAWRCKQDKIASATVAAAIDLFNRMSMWTSSEIVRPQSASERARIFTRIVEIADQLRKQNDFASMFALASGANRSCVTRLAQTFAHIRAGTLEVLQRISSLTNTERSFRSYRDLLTHAQPPLVPYLGVHLTDLTFAESGNKLTVPCPDNCGGTAINYRKVGLLVRCACVVCVCVCVLVLACSEKVPELTTLQYAVLYAICAPVIRAQETPYNISPNNDIIALFQNFSHLSEDTLHELSQYAEPRQAQAATSSDA